MTEALKIGIEAVNRWLFHGWNYEMVNVEVPDFVNGGSKTVHIPQFLAEAKWTCNLPHMIEKWNNACQPRQSGWPTLLNSMPIWMATIARFFWNGCFRITLMRKSFSKQEYNGRQDITNVL